VAIYLLHETRGESDSAHQTSIGDVQVALAGLLTGQPLMANVPITLVANPALDNKVFKRFSTITACTKLPRCEVKGQLSDVFLGKFRQSPDEFIGKLVGHQIREANVSYPQNLSEDCQF
jgi:hypothetical protein